jgi:hypothetical protein
MYIVNTDVLLKLVYCHETSFPQRCPALIPHVAYFAITGALALHMAAQSLVTCMYTISL